MATLVAAEILHSFPVEVTLPRARAAQLLDDISAMLDRSGLQRGIHWSVTAVARDTMVGLKFDLCSHALAGLLEAAIKVSTAAEPVQPQAPMIPRKAKVSAGFGPALRVVTPPPALQRMQRAVPMVSRKARVSAAFGPSLRVVAPSPVPQRTQRAVRPPSAEERLLDPDSSFRW